MSFLTQSDKAFESGRVVQCRICGRHLTDPDSRAKGIGPVCEQQINTEITQLQALDHYIHEAHWKCDCERVTPAFLFKNGKCPICRNGEVNTE